MACQTVLLGLLAALLPPAASRPAPGAFVPPFAVQAGGTPIDVPLDKNGRIEHDNAFPWFGDFDGDGRPDLLVGQHTHPGGREKAGGHGGRLRIYRNLGDRGAPRFGEPGWFDERVPTGRIPNG